VNTEATRDNDNSGDSNVQMAPEASVVDAGVNNNNCYDGSSIPMGSVHQFLDFLGENGEDPSSFTDHPIIWSQRRGGYYDTNWRWIEPVGSTNGCCLCVEIVISHHRRPSVA
jgi:hypothetical protein